MKPILGHAAFTPTPASHMARGLADANLRILHLEQENARLRKILEAVKAYPYLPKRLADLIEGMEADNPQSTAPKPD